MAEQKTRIKRADTASMWVFSVLGIAIAGATCVMAANRVFEFFRDAPVDVPVQFSGAESQIAPGGGATYALEIQTAIIQAESLPAVAVVAGIAQAVILALVVVTIIFALLRLSVRAVRGDVFGKTSTLLVLVAGLTGLIGTVVAELLGGILAIEAFAVAPAGMLSNVMVSLDVFPYIIAAFAVALIATVFGVGERLQRETEGLV